MPRGDARGVPEVPLGDEASLPGGDLCRPGAEVACGSYAHPSSYSTISG
jgi:hypothetical protein